MANNIVNTKPQPPNGGLHPAVEDFVRGVSEKYHDHDELVADNTSLRNKLTIAQGTVDHLREMLDKVTADRDYHMAHAFALASGINSAQDVLNGVFELAKRQAAAPRLPEAPQLEVP
jgi:hypothetical protein